MSNSYEVPALIAEIQAEYPALAARLAELVRNFGFDQLKQVTAVSRQVTELRRMATHQLSLPAGCVSGEAVPSSNYYIAGHE